MSNKVYVSAIAEYLGIAYSGENLTIEDVVGISNFKSRSISFINKKGYIEDINAGGLVIVWDGYKIEKESKNSYIVSSNPRLDFVKVFNRFFKLKTKMKISDTALFGKNCKLGENIVIGEYCVIKDNVTIGNNTIINNHVIIESNTVIGDDCYIKSGTIIGEDGFGFERDENDIPIRFPHIGNVLIGNNVEIGSKCTIARGTLESTVIKDNVKIDDQVFIAHNAVIGESTMIAACSEISGSTTIGKKCWIAPNSTIRDGLTIGDNVFLGLATAVSKNIKDNTKLATLSDLSFRDIASLKKLLKKSSL